LFTRSYKVEPNWFKQELERFVRTKRPDLIEAFNTDTDTLRAADTHSVPDNDATDSFKQSNGWKPMNGQLFMGQSGMDQQLANLALVEYLSSVGVEIAAPKMVYFNDRTGMILVRATTADLEIIETAVAVINEAPAQVTIETRFVEISEQDTHSLGFGWILGNTVTGPNSGAATSGGSQLTPTNTGGTFPPPGAPSVTDGNVTPEGSTITNAPESLSVTGILTDPQFRVVITALDRRKGVDIMFAPRVTTLSGRQTQIKSVNIQTIITDVTTNESGLYPVTKPMEFGPVLDVIPRVSADNSRIEMTVIATLSQFVGYDDPGATHAVYQPDKNEDAVMLPTPKPRYNLR